MEIMKTIVFRTVSIVALLNLGLAVCVLGQTLPRNVTEFYLALPGSINGIEGAQNSEIPGFEDDFFFYSNTRNESKSSILKYRKGLIKSEDLKNGYLRLESREWEGWVEISLFKKADGSSLIAISQVTCGPGCKGGLLFLTYKNGHWKNVTSQVFPISKLTGNYYELPRVGTSIALVCGDDANQSCRNREKLAEFQWDRNGFIKKSVGN